MSPAKDKTVYICSECGYQTSKWMGRCPTCQSWNTFDEHVIEAPTPQKAVKNALRLADSSAESEARPFDESDIPDYLRSETGMPELDRVLGGGLVQGSVVLISGEPGIGKSTLLMQLSGALCKSRRILYVSGEESRGQLSLRARRLGVSGELCVLTETNLERIFTQIDKVKPDIIIVDSIQTIYSELSASSPGSVTQVRDSALRFISLAKNGSGTSVILVGHVNKEGGIAGPKVLEHMVDAVLGFEGERQHSYRIIRASKNRFGSTNEIGVFEMTDHGLIEIPNPSEAMLAGRPHGVSGSCTVCVIEGSRPIIAEIQALATPTVFPSPRRTVSGIDYNRIYLLLAVLEKRAGFRFSTSDVYLNVIGGLNLEETAADLPTVLALASSLRDVPISDELIAFGEVGLSGEIRSVSRVEQRIREAERLGFTKLLLPKRDLDSCRIKPKSIELIPVSGIMDAIMYAFPKKDR